MATEPRPAPSPSRWGLPEPGHALPIAVIVAGVIAAFVLVYGGASALGALIPWRVHVHLPFERHIPFLPAWSLVYLSMDALVLLPVFALRTWRALWPYAAALVTQTLIGGACFLLLPVEVAFGPREVSGWVRAPFDFADTLNMEGNYVPSLHVAFALSAALVIASRSSRLIAALAYTWASLIALSTLLIHEHHLLDVAAGAALAIACVRWTARKYAAPHALDGVAADAQCLIECARFTRRHRRYLVVALSLVWASLGRWQRARVMRTSFCFLQVIDDVLDGDRAYDGDPAALAAHAAASLRAQSWGDAPLDRLGQSLSAGLALVTRPGDTPLTEMADLVEHMARDRARVVARAVWGADALRAHHEGTFSRSVNLLLITAGAEARAAQVPHLVAVFGWCSVMRDLEEDLRKGLCNVPAEVVAGPPPTPLTDLLHRDATRAWVRAERAQALRDLEAAAHEVRQLTDPTGVKIARLFLRSLSDFAARRMLRLYPWSA